MKTIFRQYMFQALLIGFAILTCFTTAKSTIASDASESDTSWMFHTLVDAEFVKPHVTIPMAKNFMLIDARPFKSKFINGHIPGAVNIPFSEFDEKKDLLPKDKNTLLIFYCQGVKCKLSHKAAFKAEKLGYTNVRVFAKGYPGWLSLKGKYGSVSAIYVARQIEENKTVVIDSRPLETKYVKGHIPTAMSIPFSKFDELSGKLPRGLDTPLIFYCGGLKCKLSHKSAAKALGMGYTNVVVFAKGYPEWKANYGASNETMQIQSGEVEGSIDIERFKSIIANNPESILLIDVRDADEFAKGSFPTAVSIPVEDLEPRIKDFSEKKPVVFVCGTGARSGEAFYMVKDVRESFEDVFYVEAEIDFKGNDEVEIKKAP